MHLEAGGKAKVVARILLPFSLLMNRVRVRVQPGLKWYDCAQDGIYFGGLPNSREIRRLARAHDVKCVINCCEELLGPRSEEKRQNMDFFQIPVTDYCHPTLKHLQEGVEILNRYHEKKAGVFVHCKAGKARSASIVMCFLIENNQWTPEETQRFMSGIRPQINDDLCARPAVRMFYELRLKQLAGDGSAASSTEGSEDGDALETGEESGSEVGVEEVDSD